MSKKELTDLQKLENRVAASFNLPLPYEEEPGAHSYTNRHTSNSEYANKMVITSTMRMNNKSGMLEGILQYPVKSDITIVDTILIPKQPVMANLTGQELSALKPLINDEATLMGLSPINSLSIEDQ